jgi:pimeloyl-ACP methyl ester carboxylesterase
MPEPGSVTRGDDTLAYWRWPGAGPAVLLLHGIANYARYWDFFADAVAGRLELVATDARGHGESARPQEGYAPADFVADAIAVLDALDWQRPLVVGHSMGGGHAIAFAAAHPDRVARLVIVDNSPEPMASGSERARRLTSARPERFADAAEAEAYLRRTSPGYADAVYANRLRWAFRAESGALAWRSSHDALARIFAAPRGDRWAALASLRCPTLVVRGARSNVLSAETYAGMLTTIPDARGVELEAGHNVALDRPRELADAVVAFARGLAR